MPPYSPLVLCVDDDTDDLLFITSIIQQVEPSFSIDVARNGEEALAYLQEAKIAGTLPSLILLDINMPRMNGKEALALIKADRELSRIPLVVFSTSNMPSDKLYCAHFGVDMVTKPDSIPQMQGVLQKLLYRTLHV